jgi:surfactin synthase thioesterase subunit
MKIIAFPFAGGNKTSFNTLFQKTDFDVVTINYPGRGTRIKEPLLTDTTKLVDNILDWVIQEIHTSEEYIIYGHSMGALIGFLVCRKLSKLAIQQPLKLVVTGHKAPIYPRAKRLSNMENDQFWEEVNKYGGMPDQLKDYPDLIQFFIPILKADFACLEDFWYEDEEKLNIPIDVYFGANESISYHQAKDWEMETTETVTVKEVSGGHFFIFEHPQHIHQSFLVNSKAH